MSAGLSSIGLTAVDKFLRHRSQRIVYGVPLGKKTFEFLRGETDDPEYLFDPTSEEEIINPFGEEYDLDEEQEMPDYKEEENSLLGIYLGLEQEDDEPVQKNYFIETQHKDLLTKIKELLKEDQEQDYEEDNDNIIHVTFKKPEPENNWKALDIVY